MAGLTGTSSQAPRVSTGALNTVNDLQPGIQIGSASGQISSSYPGQIGVKIFVDQADALKLSDTTAGTLYGGVYQYVGVTSTTASAANLKKGRLVFWDLSVITTLYYQVVQLESLNGGVPLIAGVLLNLDTYLPLALGSYGWIQIAGRATVQCRGTVTAATRNISWSAAGVGTDNATVDGIADATAVTQLSQGKRIAGSEAVAANGALIIANLLPDNFVLHQ